MRRFLALLIPAALLVAACAGDSGPDPADDPKGALTSALERLGGYEGITATVTLDSDTDSVVTLSEGELTADQAQVILDSSLRLTAKQGESPEDSQVELVADISGDSAELRVVDQVLFVRANVRDLVERFEGNTSDLDALVQDAPPGFEFVEPLLDGEWIALEGFQQFAEQFAGAQETDESVELQKELADNLGAAVEENSTVELVGEDDIGSHVEASIELRGLYEAFVEVIRSAPGMSTLPPGSFPPASEVPDEDLLIDAWISDGELVQIGFDFLKIAETFEAEPAPEGVEALGLLVALEEFTGDVEVPDPAERVNFQELVQGFMGFGEPGGFDTETGAGQPGVDDLCKQLEGAPAEVVEQFAEECPELQQ